MAPRIAERRSPFASTAAPIPRRRRRSPRRRSRPVEADAVAVAHLVAGAVPPPDWSRLLLDAHAEGWAAVGTALVSERRDRELEPWRGGGGRNPRFARPLLLPSLLDGVEPSEHLGLPAYDGPDGLFEGRVAVTLPRRSGRRPR